MVFNNAGIGNEVNWKKMMTDNCDKANKGNSKVSKLI